MNEHDDRHDVAACDDPLCAFCDGYGSGYAAGKRKMADEVVAALDRSHAADCVCVPCETVGAIVAVGRDTLETEIVASTRHPAGCGCRACALLRAVWTLTPAPADDDEEEEMVTAR